MMHDGYWMHGYAMSGAGVAIMLMVLAVSVFAFWRIFDRAGFAGAWGLLAILPFMQFFLLVFLALAKWPRRDNRPGADR